MNPNLLMPCSVFLHFYLIITIPLNHARTRWPHQAAELYPSNNLGSPSLDIYFLSLEERSQDRVLTKPNLAVSTVCSLAHSPSVSKFPSCPQASSTTFSSSLLKDDLAFCLVRVCLPRVLSSVFTQTSIFLYSVHLSGRKSSPFPPLLKVNAPMFILFLISIFNHSLLTAAFSQTNKNPD